MNIAPSPQKAPCYPTLAAVLAGAAALSLASCACQICEGSGLRLDTASGKIPYHPQADSPPNNRAEPCEYCKGSGSSWNATPKQQEQLTLGVICP